MRRGYIKPVNTAKWPKPRWRNFSTFPIACLESLACLSPSYVFHKSLHIDQNIRPFLANVGISKVQDFVNYSAGKLVSRPSKRHVRSLVLDLVGQKKKYFLKQSGIQSFQLVLKTWCRLQAPLSDSARELLLLELFRDQGIPVMKAVAWGEQTVLGWPMSGFILVEEVVGKEFVDVYRGASLRIRRRLFRLYGELMGTLHRKGIDSKVRPEDLICVSDNYKDFRKCFVVIDREHGHPYLRGLSMEQCGIRLGDIWVKGMYRIGLGERSELLAFLSGYLAGAGQPRVREERVGIYANLVERASRRATEVLYHDNRFETLRRGFQTLYGIDLDRFIT